VRNLAQAFCHGRPSKGNRIAKKPDFKTLANHGIDKNLAGRAHSHAVWQLVRVLRAAAQPPSAARRRAADRARACAAGWSWSWTWAVTIEVCRVASSVARAHHRKTGRIAAENVGAVVNPVDGLIHLPVTRDTLACLWPILDGLIGRAGCETSGRSRRSHERSRS
jgi:hypothetical protein